MTTVTWGNHSFTSCEPSTNWNDVAGVYIFAKIDTKTGKWTALYIGQASSFKDRLSNHERWDEAVRLGATHVHILGVQLQANRDSIEQSLIVLCQPPLNHQLK